MSTVRTLICIAAATLAATGLAACGSSSGISVSAVAKCARGHTRSELSTTSPAVADRQIIAKVVKGGWLHQSAADENPSEWNTVPEFEIYVYKDNTTAEEAFKIIENAPDAREEFGGGGTFRRSNVVITTDQNPPGSLSSYAETLLNKCVGAGATQSIMRNTSTSESSEAQPEVPYATGTTGEAPGESEASAGQSIPGRE